MSKKNTIVKKKSAESPNPRQSAIQTMGGCKLTKLGRIPKGWEVKNLLEVTTFLNGKAYNQSELLSNGKYKVLRVGNFFTNSDWYYSDLELEDNKYVEDGDLMYAWSASFGPRFWRGERTIYHYHIWKVMPSKLVTKDYLYFQLVYDTEKIFNNKQGGTMFHITKGDMEKRKVLIPPLPEQQKIARILSTWDKAIEKTEQLIAQKQQLKKGLMQQLLTGKVRFKEFVKPKKMKRTKLGMIPVEWRVTTLSEVCTKITDGTHDTPKPTNNGIPFLTAIHIKQGKINFNDCYYLPESVHREIYRRCNPEKGDVLFVNIGAGTATSAYIDVDFEFSLKNVALLKPRKETLNGKYLEQYLIQYKSKLEKTFLNGNAQPFLSLGQIGELKILLPLLKEQQRIADLLQDAGVEMKMLNQGFKALSFQKKGLMQKLLTGQIRVKI